MLLARQMDLPLREQTRIHIGAHLHDIGKIGIPDAILLKPGKLTEAEFEIMKRHCGIGGQAIRSAIDKALAMNRNKLEAGKPLSLQFLEVAKTIADHHHEKWDGSGYPQGLKGADIPLPARLMALADVFDALTTPRVYKQAWSLAETVDYVRQQSGLHFDPDVVEAFVSEQAAFAEVMSQMADRR